LHADIRLNCDTEEYETTRGTAVAMLFLWPIGVPLLYAVLLWASRAALRTGTATTLSEATAFLSGDCAAAALELTLCQLCARCTE
jgi:hypothetical protein